MDQDLYHNLTLLLLRRVRLIKSNNENILLIQNYIPIISLLLPTILTEKDCDSAAVFYPGYAVCRGKHAPKSPTATNTPPPKVTGQHEEDWLVVLTLLQFTLFMER